MISQLHTDDRAVSPVVGVALLIAVTVILAAVIGFVVLDTSTSSTETKNARLDFTYDSGSSTMAVAHEGGDTFDNSNIIVKVNGGTVNSPGVPSTFATGDSFEVSSDPGGDGTVNTGDVIVIVWDDPDSDRQIQIGQTTVE